MREGKTDLEKATIMVPGVSVNPTARYLSSLHNLWTKEIQILTVNRPLAGVVTYTCNPIFRRLGCLRQAGGLMQGDYLKRKNELGRPSLREHLAFLCGGF